MIIETKYNVDDFIDVYNISDSDKVNNLTPTIRATIKAITVSVNETTHNQPKVTYHFDNGFVDAIRESDMVVGYRNKTFYINSINGKYDGQFNGIHQIFKVIKGGRNCLSQADGYVLHPGDLLLYQPGLMGSTAIKLATPTQKSQRTSMFNSELVNPFKWNNDGFYQRIVNPRVIGKLIPHLPKQFKEIFCQQIQPVIIKKSCQQSH